MVRHRQALGMLTNGAKKPPGKGWLCREDSLFERVRRFELPAASIAIIANASPGYVSEVLRG